MSAHTVPTTGFSVAMSWGATQFSAIAGGPPPEQSFPWSGTRHAHWSLCTNPVGFCADSHVGAARKRKAAATERWTQDTRDPVRRMPYSSKDLWSVKRVNSSRTAFRPYGRHYTTGTHRGEEPFRQRRSQSFFFLRSGGRVPCSGAASFRFGFASASASPAHHATAPASISWKRSLVHTSSRCPRLV